MSVRVNVRMSKIMHTPIKVDVRTYVHDVRELSNPDTKWITISLQLSKGSSSDFDFIIKRI